MEASVLGLTQIGLLLATIIVATFRGVIPHGPGICISLIAVMILLGIISAAMEERRRTDTVLRAREEWRQECFERMDFEMARGLSEPAAQFIVKPFMMNRWPETYEQAVAYLTGRRQGLRIEPIPAQTMPGERDVLPPEGPRRITDHRWEDGEGRIW